MSTDLDEKISAIMVRILKVPPGTISESTTMDQIPAWDSLNHMDIVSALETEFGVQLSGDDIAEMLSVGKIREVLARCLDSKNGR